MCLFVTFIADDSCTESIPPCVITSIWKPLVLHNHGRVNNYYPEAFAWKCLEALPVVELHFASLLLGNI